MMLEPPVVQQCSGSAWVKACTVFTFLLRMGYKWLLTRTQNWWWCCN